MLSAMLACVVIAYFIFCTLFLTLRYAVLPNIDHYKVDIERMASDAIGEPVSIATIHASWRGLRPHLMLNNVVIYNKAGEQQLSLPKVSTTLSWWSVVVADLRFHTLEIDRPDVDIERDVQGNFVIAGILLDPHKKSDGGQGADWILSQREIVIRNGVVRWNDTMRGAPTLVLTDVDFTLHNQGRRHQFALNATPPSTFAAPIDVRADFDHPHFARKISDITLWEGTLYADWRNTDLAVWKDYFDYPFEVQKGKGSIRAWLTFDRARVADFTADLTLSNVSTRLHKDLQPLDLVQVSGRVSASEELGPEPKDGMFSFGEQGHAVALTDFSMETSNGLKLPKTTISQTFVPATKSRPEKNEVTATMLDLHTLANFVGHLPLSAGQRQMLTDFAPRGQLKDFSAKWQGSYPDLSSYHIKGQFTGLTVNAQAPRPASPKSGQVPARAAVPGIPGFDNLTGRVDASDKGGTINLASEKVVLHLPGYFADPVMPFDRLNMQAKWGPQDKNKLLVQIDSMDFVQDGVIGSLSGKHVMPLGGPTAKAPGTIDLTAKISEFDVKKIGRYLPLHTPDPLRNWLTGALQEGQAQDVAVVIKGELANFPFHTDKPMGKPKGQFTVSGKIDNGKLNYTPGILAKDEKSPLWPLLERIKGSFTIDRTRLEIKAESASTHGVALSNVKAVIPDLLSADTLLDINGNAEGKLQDFVGFTNNSPVSDWIGHFTEETKASGDATLLLKFQLPLARMSEAKVQGTLRFAGNDVTLQNGMPPMLQARGELEFHEKGLNLNGIRASFLGGPIAASGGTQRDGSIAIKVDGSLSSEGLRKTYPAPATQRLLQHITGSTRYSASIGIKKKGPEIVVESSLQGMALDFPAPLNKTAHERLPLKFEMAGLPSDDATMVRDEVKLSLGSAIVTRYLRQKSLEKNAYWRVVQGGIGVNVPAPQPDNGLIASVNLKSLDIDAWRNSVASIVGGGKQNEAETESPALGMSQYIEPDVLAARATELYIMGKKLNNVVVGASHQKGLWQANIDSEQASGYVTWNESPSGLGKATARLASLIIPQSAASDVTELLEGKNKSTQIPGLDVVADNFELFGKRLGRLELVADNNFGPNGREWRIDKLSIDNADATLKASGKWATSAGGSVSNLSYALDIADAGKLLERFGFAHVLRGGKGKMEGDLSWEGLPFSIDIPTLSGQFRLNMAAGQFLKVDPGAAKLLSVLSLQSLPRRLTLDFRDIFSEGFAFDSIAGTATIAQGTMKTDNFKMRSVNAVVLLDGSADIAKESQNLRVVVIPEINAGAASLVYGLAVNPVLGLGSFLAQLFLRDPLMRAFTVEYEITGPWKDPVINKLARKFDNVPAASDIPQGAQSGR
ncbi:MAG TPA: YhdP family protein [Burkholderiaceae bacterium]|nr:YhdP family protein [Burkholderiaceae bacterium]